MYSYRKIKDDIYMIGASDRRLALFENVYPIKDGVSYNSYFVDDEKTVVLDTVDKSVSGVFFENIKHLLNGRSLDYLIVNHMEPDHCAMIADTILRYPDVKIVGNAKTFTMIENFFGKMDRDNFVTVSEGDELCTGKHTFTFVMAPMVHWPEVMVAYDNRDKVLFAADGFGKFGALDVEEDWACEARRYYFNIVGKYGAQVQALLKKAADLDIRIICPLHGPVLKENLAYYIDKYNTWSSYTPEDDGVLIAVASIYGNTMKAANKLSEILKAKGAKKVVVTDLARDDMAEALEDAFRYDKVVFAASSYDGGVFPFMEEFLHHLKAKNYQKRKVALVENGSWGPTAAKTMKAIIEQMKEIELIEPTVTIKSTMNDDNVAQFEILAENLLK